MPAEAVAERLRFDVQGCPLLGDVPGPVRIVRPPVPGPGLTRADRPATTLPSAAGDMSIQRETNLAGVRRLLRAAARPEDAAVVRRFFKTGPGQYGEGDRFLGVRVPALRRVVLQSDGLDWSGLRALLRSGYHEERLLALLLLVRWFERGTPDARERIFRFYLANTRYINNWDLVDLSAPRIAGAWLLDRPRDILDGLAVSPNLWERRIAVLATFAFIQSGQFDDLHRVVEKLLPDRHDLIHKACGWMLREAGKRNRRALVEFLELHAAAMPRTMLRYAIEKLPPPERRRWLAGEPPCAHGQHT